MWACQNLSVFLVASSLPCRTPLERRIDLNAAQAPQADGLRLPQTLRHLRAAGRLKVWREGPGLSCSKHSCGPRTATALAATLI